MDMDMDVVEVKGEAGDFGSSFSINDNFNIFMIATSQLLIFIIIVTLKNIFEIDTRVAELSTIRLISLVGKSIGG